MSRDVIEFTFTDDHGDEQTVDLPTRFEVCSRCQGHGTHCNPNIDGNGITGSEWAEWSEEERETYLSGGYDVPCEECNGLRVVPVLDEVSCDPALLAKYRQAQADDAAYERECRAERMAEMGLAYFTG